MSSAAFSTPESVCLERKAELDDENISFEQIWNEKQKQKCLEWIKKGSFKKVCLQFPDSYLVNSTKICDQLKNNSDAKFYILADTSYGSCCVDEIAAAHVDSDSLIHFGNACQSRTTRLPVLFIFPSLPFNCDDFQGKLQALSEQQNNVNVSIYLDIYYRYLLEDEYQEVRDKIRDNLNLKNISIKNFPINKEIDDDNLENLEDVCIFIGNDNQTFFNLSMSFPAKKWFIYNPSTTTMQEVNPLATNWIRRRYFYIEKCKDAQVLGLIVATLTEDGYLDVIKHIKEMAKARGIKTHIISVGRINPEKLANFMEIDCFVLIGCPFNNLYTSKDFYKPVVSVFEAEMALNPAWNSKYPDIYATDFKDILPNGKLYNEFEPDRIEDSDVSLLTGKMRGTQKEFLEDNINSSGLLERNNYQVIGSSRGVNFEDRSWKGLEPALGLTEPAKIQKGLSGIPINYSKE